MAKTAAQATQNWANGMASGGQAWINGISGYSGESPGSLAAARADAYVSGVQSNVAKFQANVSKVSTATWQANSKAKQGSFSAGAAKGNPKYNRYANIAQSLLTQAGQQARAMGGKGDLGIALGKMQLIWAAAKQAGQAYVGSSF